MAKQKVLRVANETLFNIVDTSVRGGYSHWPASTHVTSGEFVQQLACMFSMLSPPVVADLRFESQMVHLVHQPDETSSFSLCFPVSQMTPDQRAAFDELIDRPSDHFDKVVSVKTDFTLPYGEKPPPKCSRCKSNANVSLVLSRADLLTRAAISLRAMIAKPGTDSWQTFQCLMDQVAQCVVFALKPSFGEFYHSLVSGWNELRMRNPLAKKCWKMASRMRQAHFTGRGQRALAADFFRVSKARSPFALAGDCELDDESIVSGYSVAGAFFADSMKSASTEMEATSGNKCVYMGLDVLARGGGRETLERLYARKNMQALPPAARLLAPYAWPPYFAFAQNPEMVKDVDPAALRRGVKAVTGFMYVASELGGESCLAFELGMAHWYAAWKAGCAGQQLPAAREASKRSFAPLISHVFQLGNVPSLDGENKKTTAEIARAAVGSAVAYAKNPRHDTTPFASRMRRWTGGSVDNLGEAIASKTHFYEINAFYECMQRRDTDTVVMHLLDEHPGKVLSAEFTAARIGASAFLIDDAVLVAGSRKNMEHHVVRDVVRFGMLSRFMVDLLAWCVCNDDAETAALVVAARYGTGAAVADPKHMKKDEIQTCVRDCAKRTDKARKNIVRMLLGSSRTDDDETPPSFDIGPTLEFAYHATTDPAMLTNARTFALWILQLQENAQTQATEEALHALPLYVHPHPLAGLCDGTAAHVDHPLWSVRPDLLRVTWMSLRM
jgi:hypothetical protein